MHGMRHRFIGCSRLPCIWVLTPYAAAFAGCLEFWRLCARDSVDLFHLIAAIVVSLALGVLGPGAYSVDKQNIWQAACEFAPWLRGKFIRH